MLLKKIIIKNFKSIKHKEVLIDKENTIITGDNASGKTTIFDAFCWCLHGRDSLNKTNFQIKPNGMKKPIVSVELIFEDVRFKRVLTEIYKTNSKDFEEYYDGDQLKYYVNDDEVLKKDFTTFIDNIVEPEMFKILTDVKEFTNLHWEVQRKKLFDLAGNISNDDILKNEEFKELSLGERTEKAYKKYIKTNIDMQEDVLKDVPSRIDENNEKMFECVYHLIDIEREIEILNDIILASKSNSDSTNIKIKLDELKSKKEKLLLDKDFYKKNKLVEAKQIDMEIESLRTKNTVQLTKDLFVKKEEDRVNEEKSNTITIKINSLKDKLSNIDIYIKRLESQKQSLSLEFDNTQKQVEDVSDYNCALCGQLVSKEQKKEEFKSKLKKINNEAININKEISKSKEEQEEIVNKIKELDEKYFDLKLEKSTLTLEVNNFKRLIETTEDTQEIKDLIEKKDLILQEEFDMSEIDEIDMLIKSSNETYHKIREKINLELSEKTKKLNELTEIKRKLINNEELKTRNIQLLEKLKKAKNELIYWKKQLNLLGKFEKAKCEILNEKINAFFELAKFKLFNIQKNGLIKPCCEVMYNGVLYSSLNNAMKTNIAIDIIKAFNKKYVYLPIFIDNAESVNELINTESQQIRMYVTYGNLEIKTEKEQLGV